MIIFKSDTENIELIQDVNSQLLLIFRCDQYPNGRCYFSNPINKHYFIIDSTETELITCLLKTEVFDHSVIGDPSYSIFKLNDYGQFMLI